MLVHAPTEDGKGARVLRARKGRVEAGEVRPLEEGKPIHGDVVKLRAREGSPLVYDVDVEVPAPARASTPEPQETKAPVRERTGPAMVATDEYREGWAAVFGRGARAKKKDRPS